MTFLSLGVRVDSKPENMKVQISGINNCHVCVYAYAGVIGERKGGKLDRVDKCALHLHDNCSVVAADAAQKAQL